MKCCKKSSILIIVLCLFGGCFGSKRELSPLDANAVILAFGDSLTSGTGAENNESYPAVLESLINRKIVNAGVPGEVTKSGLERLPQMLDEYHPALLILCHGGNDLLQGAKDKYIADNIKAMVKLAKERNIDVLLLGVPKYGLPLSTADFYEEIAGEFNIPCDNDMFAAIFLNPNLKSDQIHPNAAGYRKVAETVAELLRKHGAI